MSGFALDHNGFNASKNLRAQNDRLDRDISTMQSGDTGPTSRAGTSASSAVTDQREQQESSLLRPKTTYSADRPLLARASRSATKAQETAFAESRRLLRLEEARMIRVQEEEESRRREEQSAEIQRKAWEREYSHFNLDRED